MKRCLDCNHDISDSANRTVRCKSCQKEFRKHKDVHINKRRGTIRRTKELNQWGKYLASMTKEEVVCLVKKYKNEIKHCNDMNKIIKMRIRIKVMTDRYKDLSFVNGMVTKVYRQCDNCKFHNHAIAKCTLGHIIDDDSHYDDECADYEYDNEAIYKDLNDMEDDEAMERTTWIDDDQLFSSDEAHNQCHREIVIRENSMLPGTERINWDKAKTGWTNYYDDGLVTLSPDVFFGKWKVSD